jgi:hypothetical protein
MAADFSPRLPKIPLIPFITTLFYPVLCGRRVRFYALCRMERAVLAVE